MFLLIFFFFNDTATTEIYTLSLHDALPIYPSRHGSGRHARRAASLASQSGGRSRSEEHTSELQSQSNLVCRLLLEKKKKDSPILLIRLTCKKHRSTCSIYRTADY